MLLHHYAIFPSHRKEKAGKSQMSQETCLDLLILCFRRKSKKDLSISLPPDSYRDLEVVFNSFYFSSSPSRIKLFEQA